MKDAKIYISSAIFIALTAVKLALPSVSEEVTDAIREVLLLESRQTEAIMALGASLTEDGLMQVFGYQKPREADSASDFTERPVYTPRASAIETPAPEPTPKPTPEPSPEPTENPAVAAFLESQRAYSGHEIPANVCCEAPPLPFEYTEPLDGGKSSGFGFRLHPIKNEVKFHYGTDIAASTGTAVYAFADGTVRAIGENDSYGKYIILNHAEGYSTLYAHCSELCVSSGAVSRGQTIAKVGQTGAATGPHLHFELQQSDTYLNPEFYL